MIIQCDKRFLSVLNHQDNGCDKCKVEATLDLKQYKDQDKTSDENVIAVVSQEKNVYDGDTIQDDMIYDEEWEFDTDVSDFCVGGVNETMRDCNLRYLKPLPPYENV